jgi:hypothetical protein
MRGKVIDAWTGKPLVPQPITFKENEICHGPWTHLDSFYFVIVTTTTVGYGDENMADQGFMERIFFVLQSLTGFIILSSIFINVTVAVRTAESLVDGFVVRGEAEETNPDDDLKAAREQIKATFIKLGLLSGVGAWFYMIHDEMSFSNATYFVYVSLSTVGFGDLCPADDLSKIFTSIFILLGCGWFATLIGAIASYKQSYFDFNHMQRLLGVQHDGTTLNFFDFDSGGEITAGEFVIAYLVSLGKVRTCTALEILSKFKDLSLGKPTLNLEMFCARTVAIKHGMRAGYKADMEAKTAGLSPHERATSAGVAAGDGARQCSWTFHDQVLSAEETRMAHTAVDGSYLTLKAGSNVSQLTKMEEVPATFSPPLLSSPLTSPPPPSPVHRSRALEGTKGEEL